MTKSKTAPRRRGRPKQFDGRCTIRLSADEIQIARRIGRGDVSAGIRAALEFARMHIPEIIPEKKQD